MTPIWMKPIRAWRSPRKMTYEIVLDIRILHTTDDRACDERDDLRLGRVEEAESEGNGEAGLRTCAGNRRAGQIL